MMARFETRDLEFVIAELLDIEEQLQIQKEAFMPLYMKYKDKYNPVNTPYEEMEKRVLNPNGRFYRILSDGRCIGGIYGYVQSGFSDHMCLSGVYILPEMQGRGIAQKAIILLEESCKEIRRWSLEVPENEFKNRHVYEKLGYHLTDKRTVINEYLTLVNYEKCTLR